MKVQKTKINLKTDDWKFKVDLEGRRMKIYIKLNKQETSQWAMIKNAVVGTHGMSDGELAKVMMFKGLNTFMEELSKAMEEMPEEEKQKILERDASIKSIDPVPSDISVDVPSKTDESIEDSDKQG